MPLTPKKPLSEKQRAANRANAAKSTGPRSAAGKSISSQNAIQHGLASSAFQVLRLEDYRDYDRFKDDAAAFYQPINTQEMVAVEHIALAQQARIRAARLEAGIFTACRNNLGRNPGELSNLVAEFDASISQTPDPDINWMLGEAFIRWMRTDHFGFALLLRYQAHAERQHHRAVQEFDRLKSLRLPNEPIFHPQPDATEPDNPPINEPNPGASAQQIRHGCDDQRVSEVDQERPHNRHHQEGARCGPVLLHQFLHRGHGIRRDPQHEPAEARRRDRRLVVPPHRPIANRQA